MKIKIIKKDIEKNKNIKYNKSIYAIKSEYKLKFNNDLEKIKSEEERLEIEIECIKSPNIQCALTIGLFTLGIALDNLIKIIDQDLRFIVSIVYCFIIIIVLGKVFINEARREKEYKYALVALKRLEEEIKQEEMEKQIKPKLIRINKR